MNFKEYFTEDNKLKALKGFINHKVKAIDFPGEYNHAFLFREIGHLLISYKDIFKALNKPPNVKVMPKQYQTDAPRYYWWDTWWNIKDDKGNKAYIYGTLNGETAEELRPKEELYFWSIQVNDSKLFNDDDRIEYLISAIEQTFNTTITF